ncbi:TPA: DeoR/GlpR family transcriptional regulator [Escherichia coli]|nr:DeoR/GlpR family transcriptional regulator [Escherichia coli]
MLMITSFANPRVAQAFVDYMATQGVILTIQQHNQSDVWLADESQAERVRAELARFLENPADPRYLAASWQAGHTGSGLHYRRYPFFAALRERAGPVTWVMMIACVVVFIAMQILGDQEVMLWLAWPFDPTLKFEFWRYFTHALMHFSLMHILFNLLWWWYLGGAALPSSSVNTPWHDRKATQTEEKERIARKVAEQIPNGSTLFIDIGTTPEAVAHALLNHSNLRIVTNNLNVANTLMVKEDFRIILAGGELRSRDGGIIGEATLDFISQFRLDFGILGISGIDSDGSLLEFDYHEVRTKRAIIENSRHVMLVVDHSKFGRNAMVNMGSISMVDAVYTDTMPPASVMQVLKDHHIQLELC